MKFVDFVDYMSIPNQPWLLYVNLQRRTKIDPYRHVGVPGSALDLAKEFLSDGFEDPPFMSLHAMNERSTTTWGFFFFFNFLFCSQHFFLFLFQISGWAKMELFRDFIMTARRIFWHKLRERKYSKSFHRARVNICIPLKLA
jgi:hypothetical protein